MLIYPAIDLREGKCVRLQQGERERETVYSVDPLATAEAFMAQGATHLHVIDLDGAFAEKSSNREVIKKIAQTMPLRIQTGGGIRTLADMSDLFAAGITRVILGTVAARQPGIVKEAVEKFGAARIVVALDARQQKVAVEGWARSTAIDMIEFAQQLEEIGVATVIYTDIARDGMLSGVDVQGLQLLLAKTNLNVLASGGVRDLGDLQQLRALKSTRLAGVILGRSLYEGTLSLAEAVRWSEGRG
ncbi:MAG: 1-(5-phosphoribosyl)-5-[(5-phosphoribosylamino)methylideneamino]imidazole-4-carboxamide isomerase [bacterium]